MSLSALLMYKGNEFKEIKIPFGYSKSTLETLKSCFSGILGLIFYANP
jgi:hypothetical protein